MNPNPPDPPLAGHRRRDFFVAFIVIGGVFAGLSVYTWQKWADILIDFGEQLYCPWKIATGSILYRDIAYLDGGPLSQYAHAFLFKVFGVSFMTLAIANLVLLALVAALIYRCFYSCADQLTALMATVVALGLFAFSHRTVSGVFNYVAPYCYEIVHGLFLSILVIALFTQWLREGKKVPLWAAGFCAGLVFLTKPEVFFALVLCLLGGLIFHGYVKHNIKPVLAAVIRMMAAGIIPILGFFLYFLGKSGFNGACAAVAGGWVPLLATHAARNPYFQWCLGLDVVSANLRFMFLQSLIAAIAVGCAFYLCRRWEGGVQRPLLIISTAGLTALAFVPPWNECGRCLPVLGLALLGFMLVRLKKNPADASNLFPFLWTIFSLGLLLKLGIFSRLWHYGFVLAMPAVLAAIYFLLWLLPHELAQRGGSAGWFRFMLFCPLAAGLGQVCWTGLMAYQWQTVATGEGGDKMWVFPGDVRAEDTAIIKAIDWLNRSTPPDSTLAVLPANVTINYLVRRSNPCRYTYWAPPEVAAFGMQNMTDEFKRHPPDYVLVMEMEFRIYGENFFGVEPRFGRDLMSWVNAHYEVKYFDGDDWLKTGRFGLKILRRKQDVNTTAPSG